MFPAHNSIVEIAPKHRDSLCVDLHSQLAVPRNRVLLWNQQSPNSNNATQKFRVVYCNSNNNDSNDSSCAVNLVPVAVPTTALEATVSEAARSKQCHIQLAAPNSSVQQFQLVPASTGDQQDDCCRFFYIVCVAAPTLVLEADGGRGMGAELICAPKIEGADHQLFRFISAATANSPSSRSGSTTPPAAGNINNSNSNSGGAAIATFAAQLVSPGPDSTTAHAVAQGFPGDGDIVEIVPRTRRETLRVDLFSSKTVRGGKVLLWTAAQPSSRSQRWRVHYRGVIEQPQPNAGAPSSAFCSPLMSFIPIGLPTASLDTCGGDGQQCTIEATNEESARQNFRLERVAPAAEVDKSNHVYFIIRNSETGEALASNQGRGLGAELVSSNQTTTAEEDEAFHFRFLTIAKTDIAAATESPLLQQGKVFVGTPASFVPPQAVFVEPVAAAAPAAAASSYASPFFPEQQQEQQQQVRAPLPSMPPMGYTGGEK